MNDTTLNLLISSGSALLIALIGASSQIIVELIKNRAQRKTRETRISKENTAISKDVSKNEIHLQHKDRKVVRYLPVFLITFTSVFLIFYIVLSKYNTNWVDMLTPSGWTNSGVQCRVVNGWIEFKGYYDHPPMSGWPTGKFLLLPEPCRPLSTRKTEMPCHGKIENAPTRPRNVVCNNDFDSTGEVGIYTDFEVIQQRFEGVRIWRGKN